MALNYIRKGEGIPVTTGGKAGFGIDRDGLLAINKDADRVDRYIPTVGYKACTGVTTLTYADSGKVVAFNSTTDFAITLPATKAGVQFTFVIAALPATNQHSISPNANDKIMGVGVSALDDKDLESETGTSRVGDAVTIVGDGSLGWYVTKAVGTWVREA